MKSSPRDQKDSGVSEASGRTSIHELTHNGITWVDVENPTSEILRELKAQYQFHPLDMEDIVSPAQRPKLETHKNYAFFVFRFPHATPRRLRATEIDVFLFKDRLITFHTHDSNKIRSIFSDAKLFQDKRAAMFGSGPDHLLYELLSILFEQNYDLTDQISQDLDRIESRIFEHKQRHHDVITDISTNRRSILDLRKVFKPQATFLKQAITSANSYIREDEQIFWRNLIDTAENQWELSETHLGTIEGLAATNDSLVNHRLNETFRLLTIISVLFLPVSFLLDLLSTNVPGNPLPERTIIFGVVIGVLVIAELVFLWFLRARKVL